MTYRSLELTERQWQNQVVELAHVLGYRTYHTWNAQHSGAGFPDLVLVRAPRVIFVELKRQRARGASMAQQVWLDELGQCDGVEVYLWRPDDWPEVERVLKGESRVEIVVEEIE